MLVAALAVAAASAGGAAATITGAFSRAPGAAAIRTPPSMARGWSDRRDRYFRLWITPRRADRGGGVVGPGA
jgi:hypothetical protein